MMVSSHQAAVPVNGYMLFVVGGTSETAGVAQCLAAAGFEVVVSTATDVPLDLGEHPRLRRRSGKLGKEAMEDFLRRHQVRAVVDVSHPYAVSASSTARIVAEQVGIPYICWVRPRAIEPADFISFAVGHEEAARLACSFGKPVLLTTGSRNLTPYVREATRQNVDLAVRVLDDPESIQAGLAAGIPESHIITGRGPFSVADNLSAIRIFRIGVLVTKDGGIAGGALEKVEAARLTGCRVVVVERPSASSHPTFATTGDLIEAVSRLLLPSDTHQPASDEPS